MTKYQMPSPLASHTGVRKPTSSSHVGSMKPTSASHFGDMSTTSMSHVKDKQATIAIHVGGMILFTASHTGKNHQPLQVMLEINTSLCKSHWGKPTTASHVGGIDTVENPRSIGLQDQIPL
jgi:hypothetical protein